LIEFESLAAIETYLATKQIAIEEKYQTTIKAIKAMPRFRTFCLLGKRT